MGNQKKQSFRESEAINPSREFWKLLEALSNVVRSAEYRYISCMRIPDGSQGLFYKSSRWIQNDDCLTTTET
jgi:hypothetical protein